MVSPRRALAPADFSAAGRVPTQGGGGLEGGCNRLLLLLLLLLLLFEGIRNVDADYLYGYLPNDPRKSRPVF